VRLLIDDVPKTANGSSVHAAAYRLALAGLHGVAVTQAMRDEIVSTILDLVRAGHPDPAELAHHAAARALALLPA
jgi:glycerate-2-kinase